MIENNVDDDLIHRSPIRVRSTRARMSVSLGEGEHGLVNHPYFTSKWVRTSWKMAKDKYHKIPCVCGNQCRTCSRCNKGVTVCLDCQWSHFECVMSFVLIA